MSPCHKFANWPKESALETMEDCLRIGRYRTPPEIITGDNTISTLDYH